MKRYRTQHEWGVIGQCKKPYREFAYCPLCRQYTDSKHRGYITQRMFRALVVMLSETHNPVYDADSNTLYLNGRGKNWRVSR